MNRPGTRVLIVGAGPTGLTAAVELARRGISVDVIDRKTSGSSFSRAVGILPGSLMLLEDAGVTSKLLTQGVKLREMLIYQNDRLKLKLPTKGAHPQYDFVLALAQDRTENILIEALQGYGGSVRYNTELVDFEQDSNQVIVTDSHGNQTSYDYLIGADGVRSATRQKLGLDYAGYDLPETWSIADVDAEGWSNNNGFTICRLAHGKVVVVAPMEATRYRIVSNTNDALAALPLPLNISRIRRTGEFNISIRQVPQYRVGRVLLAGDAAHCHSPVGGRGMNLGIADGVELANCIAEGTTADYSDVRHKIGAQTIAFSERARKLITSQGALSDWLFPRTLEIAGLLPFMKGQIARNFLQN